MMDLKVIKDVNSLKFKVGDKVFYRGGWGTEAQVSCEITGVGEKNGLVVYDNSLGHWGFVEQYRFIRLFPDPDVGLDAPVQCHNLDRAPLQRISHRCQSSHDYYRSGDPAGSVRVIYTLEDGRLLVAAPDAHGVERYYVAAEKTHLVLVEDVTRQFVAEDRHYITGALPEGARVDSARVLP